MPFKPTYIVIHRQTVSLYHNSSVWLDTRDILSRDRSQADFTSVGYLTPAYRQSQRKWEDILEYIHMYAIGYLSAQFMRRPLHLHLSDNHAIPRSNAQTIGFILASTDRLLPFVTNLQCGSVFQSDSPRSSFIYPSQLIEMHLLIRAYFPILLCFT